MNTGIIYLIRNSEDSLQYTKAFADSFRKYPVGDTKHRLILCFKGFTESWQIAIHKKCFLGIDYVTYYCQDVGYSMETFWKVMNEFACDKFVCLNSYSRINVERWLDIMDESLVTEYVGLVGVSSSSVSIFNCLLRQGKYAKAIIAYLWFKPEPNYHIRTNAFLGWKHIFMEIKLPRMRRKIDECRFESGRNGLTQRLIKLGYSVTTVVNNKSLVLDNHITQ